MTTMRSILLGLPLSIVLLVSAHAEDLTHGKALHQASCTRCHQPDLYERADRNIKNLKHLRSQVLFCAVSNDVEWFDEEVDDVTFYLNTLFYLFNMK